MNPVFYLGAGPALVRCFSGQIIFTFNNFGFPLFRGLLCGVIVTGPIIDLAQFQRNSHQ